jgi:4-alpha-glucanotransferase
MIRNPQGTTVTSAAFRSRSSGLLLHLTSLPGRHGSGDLSETAFEFVNFLSSAGQSWWQMLPVGPPQPPPGDSPYSSSSAVAGSPYLVSLEKLWQAGWLNRQQIMPDPRFDAGRVRFRLIRAYRDRRLRWAWERFKSSPLPRRREFSDFCEEHRSWLEDFALFCALKERFRQAPWTNWPEELRRRRPAELAEARRTFLPEIDYHGWVQFQFHQQWGALRDYAHRRRVGLIGDVPVCVSHDSADVWAQPELFKLNSVGRPTVFSGYPPDSYSSRGQVWGHPLYHWPAHQTTRFRWWISRFREAYRAFDAVRIDHFLGFTRLWSIPAGARTARHGRWLRTPGRDLLSAVRTSLGDRPMIAEDLGRVTPGDIALRDDFGIPAMRILQWGLDRGDPSHAPHRFTEHTVAYSGTHDTNTTLGWFRSLKPRARKTVLGYLGGDGRQIHLDAIRAAMNSVANTVIVPVQDLLGLDGDARMNRPGTGTGNWWWRLPPRQLTPALARTLRSLTELSDRLPQRLKAV